MKDCKDCEYFHGYDYSDGTLVCEYEDNLGKTGYEACPYCNEVPLKEKTNMKCEIDMGDLNEYITHTVLNSVRHKIDEEIHNVVVSIINKEYEQRIKTKTEESIETLVNDVVNKYMQGNMVIGGGWGEPAKEVTREVYLGNLIQDKLDKVLNNNAFSEQISSIVRSKLQRFQEDLKMNINQQLKQEFDEATRQTLTDNVVAMLMSNDTYKKLSDSMQRLIP